MMFNELEFIEALRYRAEQVRARLRAEDVGLSMTLTITITGQVQHGDLAVTFSADALAHDGVAVKANSLDAAAEELLRRMGFTKAHQTLLLTAPRRAPPESHTQRVMDGLDGETPF